MDTLIFSCCFFCIAVPSFSLYFFYYLVLSCNKFVEDGDSAGLLAHLQSSLGFLIFGAIIDFFFYRSSIKHYSFSRHDYDANGRKHMATHEVIEEREAAAEAAAEAHSSDFDKSRKSNRIRASLALSAACYICCAPDCGLMWAAVFGSFVIVDFNWFNQMRARC